MDDLRFDTITRSLSGVPTRRAALRLLAAGLLAGLGAPRLARAAMQADGDGDGLSDEDEINVSGTDPDGVDTDGDGIGDGEEIYNRD